ncbi:MAG: hypothetical protein QN152_05105 [Armatimonadota bacterium]|nr:hypothetical protein [Armatimonadota bacterium]MDR7427636.1 hypothetical protein [Armatimonadota bacterium]MDR7465231.1 hypothetical protein [Armatimonadota bacterium]MDR7470955.1 hypothetical protein [Armatimonadota bacterium]MDR7473583.1 hypothetical protein [Armatimonadota bacterium]
MDDFVSASNDREDFDDSTAPPSGLRRSRPAATAGMARYGSGGGARAQKPLEVLI